MNSALLLFMLLAGLPSWAGAVEENDSAPDHESRPEASKAEEEGEAKGSATAITPITVFPQKNPYEQAVEELAQADDLWKKGEAEAASDKALEAYDDLMEAWVPKKLRAKRRMQKRQAAVLYIDSSIAYIQEQARKAGNSRGALEQARERLGDLRDVAINYPDLSKKLNKAMQQYLVELSTSTAR